MQRIDIKVTGDAAWPELDPAKGGKLVELQSDVLQVAFLGDGTEGGQPVVLLRSDHEGTAYVMQLTASNFRGIAAAFKGKYE